MYESLKWTAGLFIIAIWIGLSSAVVQATTESTQPTTPSTEAQKAVSAINVPESTFDFGEIKEGGEVVHDFIVRNTGTARLEINQVRPG